MRCLALGTASIKHHRVEPERPVIVLTPTGYQCHSFINDEQVTDFIQQAERLIRNLKQYREGLVGWQYDLFQGSELPVELRRLGFKDPG